MLRVADFEHEFVSITAPVGARSMAHVSKELTLGKVEDGIAVSVQRKFCG